jgi:imidazolonepropionase-like amidohydrolase
LRYFKMIILENALLYTMKKPPFVGNILIDREKIKRVSPKRIQDKVDERIDLNGAVVTPGFIDAHTHQGLFQGDIGWAGMDLNEKTDPVTPHLRAIDAINPDDPSLVEAPEGGVTTINTGPGSANVIGGQYCTIKTHGTVIDEMVIKNPSCLKIAFGENPKSVYGSKSKVPQTRMAIAAVLRENLFKAREYLNKNIKSAKGKRDGKKKPDFDLKFEILSGALTRKLPVHAHCHRADDIITAIRIADEFNLKLVLIHATEGHKIADFIARKNIPAVIGPSFAGREKVELREISFKTPGILSRAGVKVCLQSDTYPPLRYFQAILCMAIKEGMDRDEALRAVTVNPANVLGIDKRVGSIESGKDADLVVWSSTPTDFYSRVLMTFINGERVYLAP